MQVSEAATRFINENGFSASTKVGYRERLGRIEAATTNDNIKAVDLEDLVYAIGMGGSGNYRNTLVSTYRSFFGWCLRNGLIDVDPTLGLSQRVKSDSRPVKQNHWMSAAEVRSFLDWLPTTTTRERRDQLLFTLGFTTGLRRAELQAMTFDRVDLSQAKAFILGKGRKLAEVYLHEEARNLLVNWKEELDELTYYVADSEQEDWTGYVLPPLREIWSGDCRLHTVLPGPLSLRQISSIVKETSYVYGRPFATHDMRRSFAGIVQDQLGDIRSTSQALRHSNIGTTQRYLETRQDAAWHIGRELSF